MIREIGVELKTELQRQLVPFEVVYRDVAQQTTWGRNRIVVERIAKEEVGSPRVTSVNPKRLYLRNILGKITIYAQSTAAGAKDFEHERVADNAVDAVLCALKLIAARRRQGLKIGRSEQVKVADLDKSEVAGGTKHEIEFAVERAVSKRTWANEIQPEFTIPANGVRSVTKVSRAHRDDDDDDMTIPADAEIACGG